MKCSSPCCRIVRWCGEAIGTIVAFSLAFYPLRDRADALALALAATAAVGYTMLTFELMLASRSQVGTLTDQLALQRDELEASKVALGRQLEVAEQQEIRAKEAAGSAYRTYLESVYARYDATAPQVAISLTNEGGRAELLDVCSGNWLQPEQWPDFVKIDESGNYKVQVVVPIKLSNFGTNAVLVTNNNISSGQLIVPATGKAWPNTWTLPPGSDAKAAVVHWHYERSLKDLLLVMGSSPRFGVKCCFEVRDLMGNVVDAHALEFDFKATEKGDSRVRLIVPLAFEERDGEGRATGGAAKVTRTYRNPTD